MVYPKPITAVEKVEAAAGRVAYAPGLDGSSRPYQRIFFGAQRDWPNDEVGWTRVPHSKTIHKRTVDGEVLSYTVRVNRRDINRYERKQAGWNLLPRD
jgi:hypothetical protein